MIRPGPRLLRALALVTLPALLAPVAPWAPALSALGLAVLATLVAREALALRRLRVAAERPEAIVLSLDEEESLPLRLSTSAARPVRLAVRQVWPDLLDRPASQFQGVCRPGESL